MSVDIQNCVPVTPTPLEKIKENVTKAGAWIWEHKKWVVLAVATTTGVILLVKKRTAIKDFFQSFHIEKLTDKSAVSEIAEENVPSILCDALSHRTGNMLTATKLGGKVGVSNREINKRLVAAGATGRSLRGRLCEVRHADETGSQLCGSRRLCKGKERHTGDEAHSRRGSCGISQCG